MNRYVRAVVSLASAALLAACGGDDGDDSAGRASSARTVNIAMRDISFSPDALTVARGERVTFVFTNEGKVAHDAYVGDAEAQADHEREMRGSGDGGHAGHGKDGEAITVEPGETGKLTLTFDAAGRTQIGCHQPGHYAAGMKLAITITP